jgi:hypothetical protein
MDLVNIMETLIGLKKLDFYPKIDEPFNDISELIALQWRRFCQCCCGNGSYYSLSSVRSWKRKLSERSDAEETDSLSNDLEEVLRRIFLIKIFPMQRNGGIPNRDISRWDIISGEDKFDADSIKTCLVAKFPERTFYN